MSEPLSFLSGKVFLHGGDCREILHGFADASIDSVVCDPPYALVSIVKRFGKPGSAAAKNNDVYARASSGFMGKQWDTGEAAFAVEFWEQVHRVLKPGGHVAAFSGTRTYHRLACAIEDAGFEIRDQLAWAYGCLDEETRAVTKRGLLGHSELRIGDSVLSYDVSTSSYKWELVEEVFVYEIDDTVFRISTDYGDQIVSRNHRCLVEQSGAEIFRFAEEAAREHEIRLPILEDLSCLLEAVSKSNTGTGQSQSNVHEGVSFKDTEHKEDWNPITIQSEGNDGLRPLRIGEVYSASVGEGEKRQFLLQPQVSREGGIRSGPDSSLIKGKGELETGIRIGVNQENDRSDKSGLGWRHNVPQQEGKLCQCSIREVSAGIYPDVAERCVCDGTQTGGSENIEEGIISLGMRPPHRPRSAEQQTDQSDVVQDESRSQIVRAWGGHKTVVGRIEPERYRGIVWCVRVKTGAFVAVRNGFAFPTGNSGFPKSHNVDHGLWSGVATCQSKNNAPLVVQVSAFIRLNCEGGRGPIVVAPALILPEGSPALIIQTGVEAGSLGVTVMSLSEPELTTISLSTGWSWEMRSAESLDPRNMYTTETISNQITLTKTLKSLTSLVTQKSTQEDVTLQNGWLWPAATVANRFSEENTNKSVIPILTVAENVMWNPVARAKGTGSSLKPAWEPICLARKPLNGTVAANVLEYGTGALNIDGCRVGDEVFGVTVSTGILISENGSMTGGNSAIVAAGTKVGRWPANIIHDGSDEVLSCFPEVKTSKATVTSTPGSVYGNGAGLPSHTGTYGADESGSAARFFYSAKADKNDRIGSKHPTVKPVDLMQWLCRLITPPGGTVLDPFAGSGSTGEAAWREGFTCHLVERETEYQADIAERLRLADKGQIERRQRAIKQIVGAGPLFNTL
jgi:DNA modification methylase